MIKYIITKKDGSTSSKTTSNIQDFIDWRDQCIAAGVWGKSQREIVALSESYEESDILSTRSETISEITTDYVTLKAEYIITEEDITAEYDAEQLRKSRLAEGKKARQCCSDILDFIGGFNVERELSLAEIQQMLADFSSAYSALQANMPRTVRTILNGMTASALIPQELLDEVAVILTRHGY